MASKETTQQVLRAHYATIAENRRTSTEALTSHLEDIEGLSTLQTKLASKPFNTFMKGLGSPGAANLLYGIIAIRAYLDEQNVTDEHQTHLEALLAALDDSQANLLNLKGSAERLDNVLERGQAWLEFIQTDPSRNTAETRALLTSLYTVLTITSNNLQEKKSSFAFRATGIQADKKIEEIQTSLTALENLLAEPEAKLDLENQAKPTFVTTDQRSFHYAIDNLETLIEARQQEKVLKNQAKAAQNILTALDQNEQKTVGRNYALDLINQHRDDFDTLVQHAPEKEQQAWKERMATLENPDATQQLSNAGLSTLSWAASPINAIYRAITTQETQDWVNSTMPATFDSESKDQLRALATARIKALPSELKQEKLRLVQAKITFVMYADLGEHKAENIVDGPIQQLQALHADGVTVQNQLKQLNQKIDDIKIPESNESKKVVTRFRETINNLIQRFFTKTPEERQEVIQAVDKKATTFFERITQRFSEFKQQFIQEKTEVKEVKSENTADESPVNKHKP